MEKENAAGMQDVAEKRGAVYPEASVLRAGQMPLDSGMQELIRHGTQSFPIQYYVDELYSFQEQKVPLHWHSMLEFFVVRGGSVRIVAGTAELTLPEGCGIFLNLNVLHGFQQENHGNRCECPNIVFSEEVIAPIHSIIHQKYIQPVIQNQNLPYIVFDPKVEWQKEVLDGLDLIFSLFQRYGAVGAYGKAPELSYQNDGVQSSCYEMEVQQSLSRIWQEMVTHLEEVVFQPFTKKEQQLMIRMRKMLDFIQNHYAEGIRLEEIAESAIISKSEASRCFQTYMHTSPGQYLMRYRMDQAKRLLLNTAKTVEEISQECGFYSASYFCKLFREQNGMTAMNYRKR